MDTNTIVVELNAVVIVVFDVVVVADNKFAVVVFHVVLFVFDVIDVCCWCHRCFLSFLSGWYLF